MEKQIEYRCGVCREPVDDGEGSIWVSMAEVHRSKEEAEREIVERRTTPTAEYVASRLVSVADLPEDTRARWRVTHNACSEGDGTGEYWFDVGRARTWHELVDWSAHLLEKDWLVHTRWDGFLQGLLYGRRSS